MLSVITLSVVPPLKCQRVHHFLRGSLTISSLWIKSCLNLKEITHAKKPGSKIERRFGQIRHRPCRPKTFRAPRSLPPLHLAWRNEVVEIFFVGNVDFRRKNVLRARQDFPNLGAGQAQVFFVDYIFQTRAQCYKTFSVRNLRIFVIS